MGKPSLVRIIRTDFLSSLVVVFPLVGLGMAGAAFMGVLPQGGRQQSVDDHRTAAGSERFFLIFAAITTVVGVFLLAWRVAKIRRAFRGTQLEGKVTKITKFRDRAYLHYRYRVGDRTVDTKHFVRQTKALRSLAEGQAVAIACDPAAPTGGFVVELFAS